MRPAPAHSTRTAPTYFHPLPYGAGRWRHALGCQPGRGACASSAAICRGLIHYAPPGGEGAPRNAMSPLPFGGA